MYYVYVLISLKDRMLYTGETTNLKIRLKQHQAGEVKSTTFRRPLKLLYYEAYRFEEDALRREEYLKGGNGRASLKIQLSALLKTEKYRYI